MPPVDQAVCTLSQLELEEVLVRLPLLLVVVVTFVVEPVLVVLRVVALEPTSGCLDLQSSEHPGTGTQSCLLSPHPSSEQPGGISALQRVSNTTRCLCYEIRQPSSSSGRDTSISHTSA